MRERREVMSSVFAWFVATIVTLPLLGWYLIYIIMVKITKNKSKSIRRASDWSAILFMAAVYFILYELWDRSFLWMIFSVFFLLALLFTWMHWRVSGDIHTRKLLRGIWRLNFMLFLFFYLLLSSYGLITRIIS